MITCIRCEDWQEDSNRRDPDKPACVGLECHGYHEGCSCQACVDRQFIERWELWAKAKAMEDKLCGIVIVDNKTKET